MLAVIKSAAFLFCFLFMATGAVDVQVVEREGAEHPDAHFHGFVLTDVFTHHVQEVAIPTGGDTRSLRDEGSVTHQHTIVRSRLQFKSARSKRLLWSPVATQVSHLDASATKSREKVRAIAMLTFMNMAWDTIWYKWSTRDHLAPLAATGDVIYNLTDKGADALVAREALRKFANATRAEAAAAASAAGGSFNFEFDAPKGHSRETTGINALLFTKGREHILAFRDTESPGTFSSEASTIPMTPISVILVTEARTHRVNSKCRPCCTSRR